MLHTCSAPGLPAHPHESSHATHNHATLRKLREIFSIDAGQYLQSLCGAAALRLLNTPGKSGAVFFLSQDDQVNRGGGWQSEGSVWLDKRLELCSGVSGQPGTRGRGVKSEAQGGEREYSSERGVNVNRREGG